MPLARRHHRTGISYSAHDHSPRPAARRRPLGECSTSPLASPRRRVGLVQARFAFMEDIARPPPRQYDIGEEDTRALSGCRIAGFDLFLDEFVNDSAGRSRSLGACSRADWLAHFGFTGTRPHYRHMKGGYGFAAVPPAATYERRARSLPASRRHHYAAGRLLAQFL